MSVQLLERPTTDRYGVEQTTAHRPGEGSTPSGKRYVQTRNGLPAPHYQYRGLRESMSPSEAEYWLTHFHR